MRSCVDVDARQRHKGAVSPKTPVMTARQLALSALHRVEVDKAFAGSALRALFVQAPGMSPADKGLATELVYGSLRRREQLDLAIAHQSQRRFKDIDPKLHDVLRLAAYQLFFLERVPAHAAVNEAVKQAKKRMGPRPAGFVNAVLRRLADQKLEDCLPKTALESDPVEAIRVQGSLPRWLAERLLSDLGPNAALAFALASLSEAQLSLRVNRLRADPKALAVQLGAEPGGLEESLKLPEGFGELPAERPEVKNGLCSPQDEASMRVVRLLDPKPGDRVLDTCAAPGGKTCHMAEIMKDQGHIAAYDILPNRLARVARQAQRLGLSIIECLELLPEATPQFDKILVDAPCSGLGTLRRHPEIRWRLRPDDITELAKTQHQLLEAAALRLKPQGELVYSVCTVTKAEAEDHLSRLPEGLCLMERLRLSPDQDGAPDGFFAMKLQKSA